MALFKIRLRGGEQSRLSQRERLASTQTDSATQPPAVLLVLQEPLRTRAHVPVFDLGQVERAVGADLDVAWVDGLHQLGAYIARERRRRQAC